MADLSLNARNSVARQKDLFDKAESECGLPLRSLKTLTGIPFSTLKGWRDGAAMPAWALGALGKAGVPDDLLSLVLAPFERHVGTDEEGEGDFDDAAIVANELASSVQRARHPNSPGGVAIVHTEKAEIRPLARRACAKIRAVAA